MKFFKKLEGEKVYLSPISTEPVETYAKWMNDFQVTDYTHASGGLFSLEDEKAWATENATGPSQYTFAIVKQENDEMIGTISFNRVNQIDRRGSVGIMIGDAENRNKGYGTEALQLLLDYGFHYLNFHSIELSLLDDNERAKRCYEKVGFREVGRDREAIFLNGKYHDHLHMDMLRSEFQGEFIRNKNVK